MRCRTHRAVTIEYRGKQDSVYITCGCGAVEFAAVWYDQAPRGWSRRQWPKLIEAVRSYLESMECALR